MASLSNKKGSNVKRFTKSSTNYKTKLQHYLVWDYEKLKSLGVAIFLPAGYPNSVTPDYLRYQILNALQAFCSSLASLISSRATLEGFGIGSASASANDALLLTIFLDICSRFTTIISAHMLGSSLASECKKYRFLADTLWDVAVVLDTLSPMFKSQGYPSLRIVALGLSAACRALVGIAVGGSKAAISLHFASPLGGKGDLGDLNAKDSSKETLLALFGMLLGSLIVPRLQSAWSTYLTLLVLLSLHLVINYVMVHGLVLRTFNHQRLWFAYYFHLTSNPAHPPTPEYVNPLERLHESPGLFRCPLTQKPVGQVTFGTSLAKLLDGPMKPELLARMGKEGYMIWFEKECLAYPEEGSVDPFVVGYPRLHVCWHTSPEGNFDVRRAYLHAGHICHAIQQARIASAEAATTSAGQEKEGKQEGGLKLAATELVMRGYDATVGLFDPKKPSRKPFAEAMRKLHWDLESFVAESPQADGVVVSYGFSYDMKQE